MLSKRHAVLAKIAAQDDTRPILQHIRVTSEYAEACDGFFHLRIPQDPETAFTQAPVKAGSPLTTPVLIPAPAVVEALKHVDKQKWGNKFVSVGVKEEGVTLFARDEGADHPYEVVIPQDGKAKNYPNMGRLIPEHAPSSQSGVYIGLTLHCLKYLVAAMEALGANIVRLQAHDWKSPVRLEFSGEGNSEVVGIMMPGYWKEEKE